jgi:electron transfer flavoprotein beta subunit
MMHIVVCVKQVPDSREIKIDPVAGTLIRRGVPSTVNPYDLHGLEAALRLKEQFGARVTVLSMGPPSADKQLQFCISLGADEAVLISDRAFAGADTLATSYVVASGIQKVEQTWGPVDIIFCGKQTVDGDTGQVGPGVACRLDVDQLTYVEMIESVDVEHETIVVRRHLEDGVERVKARLPVLITALMELGKVRRASMPGMLRSARYKPIVWTSADFPDMDTSKIGLRGSPTVVSKTWAPEPRRVETEYMNGDTKVAARTLITTLRKSELATKLNWNTGGCSAWLK